MGERIEGELNRLRSHVYLARALRRTSWRTIALQIVRKAGAPHISAMTGRERLYAP